MNEWMNEWARNQGVAWQHNTKNTMFVYIIKQLYHSLSSYMNSYAMSSYTTGAHGIIVKYIWNYLKHIQLVITQCFMLNAESSEYCVKHEIMCND